MKNEQTGKRASIFSEFQRRVKSTRCKVIDTDWIGYCPRCKEPYALFEECVSGFANKKAFVLEKLAHKANLPAYVIQSNAENWLVQRVYPEGPSQLKTSEEMRNFLLRLHDTHRCESKQFPHEGKRWDAALQCDVWAHTGEHRIWDFTSRRMITVQGVEGEPCPWVEPEDTSSALYQARVLQEASHG